MFKRRRRKPPIGGLLWPIAVLIVIYGMNYKKLFNVKGIPETVQHYVEIGLYGFGILIAVIFLFYLGRLVIKGVAQGAKRRRREALLRGSDIQRIDMMTGTQFEQYATVYFTDLGYRVEPKGGSRDKGADLILIDPRGRRKVAQCKCYGQPVGFEAVQQAYTAKALYKCQDALVITNNRFTKQARETARELQVELWDRERLMEHMFAYNQRKNHTFAEEVAAAAESVLVALPNSSVFHTLTCKNGKNIAAKSEAIRFTDMQAALSSGRRKCQCYE